MRKIVQKIIIRASTLGELFTFFWQQKHWWLIPALVILTMGGVLTLIAHSSPIIPIVYPLF